MSGPTIQRDEHDEKTRRFVALLGAHDRQVLGYILSLVPSFSDAEELAQQVRLRLWQQFDEYNPEKDFGAWAKTISYYFVLSHRKNISNQRKKFSPETMELLADRMSTETASESDQRWAMQECLGKMDESKRQLLMRYYSTGQTLQEIATEVGRTFNAVKNSILRSRLILADCIERVVRREGSK